MLKVATKTLEITEDNLNENLLKKQRPDVLYKKSSYLPKFIRKHLYQSVFFNKVANLSPAILFKRDSDQGDFLRILRNFQKHLFHRTPSGDCFWYLYASSCNL